MSDEARAIKRGSVVRYQGKHCLVLESYGARVRLQPAHEAPLPVPVPAAECEPTEMTLATPGSRAYWAKGGGVSTASEGDSDE